MKVSKFKKSCKMLFDTFDSISISYPKLLPKWEKGEAEGSCLTNYLVHCTPKLQKLVDESFPVEYWFDLVYLSFGLGFIIGMTVEPTHPKTKEAIKNIKQTMKEEQLLPYLPREKRGVSG